MKARIAKNTLAGKRYGSWQDGMAYTSLGKTTFRRFADKIGATRKIGNRVVFDFDIIDQALAEQTAGKVNSDAGRE